MFCGRTVEHTEVRAALRLQLPAGLLCASLPVEVTTTKGLATPPHVHSIAGASQPAPCPPCPGSCWWCTYRWCRDCCHRSFRRGHKPRTCCWCGRRCWDRGPGAAGRQASRAQALWPLRPKLCSTLLFTSSSYLAQSELTSQSLPTWHFLAGTSSVAHSPPQSLSLSMDGSKVLLEHQGCRREKAAE